MRAGRAGRRWGMAGKRSKEARGTKEGKKARGLDTAWGKG